MTIAAPWSRSAIAGGAVTRARAARQRANAGETLPYIAPGYASYHHLAGL